MGSELVKNYKDTLNLPKTDFPMRGSLPQREPGQVRLWFDKQIYFRMLERNRKKNKGKYLLHDGPPYANGNIHLGHTLNKVLKDVVVKYKNMSGYDATFVPGWDCHGLPIEIGVEKQLVEQKREKASVSIGERREMCRAYAKKYIALQMSQFQRLEVFADWEHPYLTMNNGYVASIIRELGKCAEAKVLYKGNKPVHWCASCTTALAEAEIEYAEKKSLSVYVKFDLTPEAVASFPELAAAASRENASRVSIIIWTTTPWTLPANLGICLHPEFDYSVIKGRGQKGTELWIVASGLKESFEKVARFEPGLETVLTFKAEKLHRKEARHPFIDKKSLLMLAEHVTLETGTGAVHTAPGHGVEDFRIGLQYGLPAYAPVDEHGKFTAEFQPMQGQFVFKTNEAIVDVLKSTDSVIAQEEIKHSYPHCWRCHKPVIFRATPQWFISMDPRADITRSLRSEAKKIIGKVEWIPNWGINRIMSMVESRPDWCISRQRVWGVPITVFYCESCGEAKADAATLNHVAQLVETEGVDIWFGWPIEKLLPPGSKCRKCNGSIFRKESDILDVWFDSGVSHAAVCESLALGWPADLYLEGSDQHRGWFQTSLLTAVATRGKAPYKTVLTHGFVNDEAGKKMSKSKGNVTSPLDVMDVHGAEILRLWVVLEDYRDDVNFSTENIERVSESYRKIRNTVRFMLGNFYDFNPDKDALPINQLGNLDRWALAKAYEVFKKINSAFNAFEFHSVYQQLVNFCITDLSSLYFDILKDRLYTAGTNSIERRSSQTVMWMICSALTRSIAPILSFTAEEIWGFMPAHNGKSDSVFLTDFPSSSEELKEWENEAIAEKFIKIWAVRDAVLKALEETRQAKTIGHPREAKVTLTVDAETMDNIRGIGEDMGRLCLVSQLELKAGTSMNVSIGVAAGKKCARCWVYSPSVGTSAQNPDLCDRCQEAV
ncbi:MAG: isoleucine--tRNA ligase [Bdellovibrionota bacterium]